MLYMYVYTEVTTSTWVYTVYRSTCSTHACGTVVHTHTRVARVYLQYIIYLDLDIICVRLIVILPGIHVYRIYYHFTFYINISTSLSNFLRA
jgi:hypothetical protein